MAKKQSESLALVKGQVEQAAQSALDNRQSQEKAVEAAMRIGAIGTMNIIAQQFSTYLGAQALRALEDFAETKGHEALGFERFDDFLNESPHSPMTKHQYYERHGALEKEGDQVFDVLNTLRVPVSARKLLGEGAVQIEGGDIVVGNVRVPVTNASAVKNLIKELAVEAARQSKQIEKGSEQNKKLKKERDELKKRGSSSAALDDYDQALLQTLGALANLKSLAYALPDADRLVKREYTFERIAEARMELEDALGVSAPSANGEFDLAEDDLSDLIDTM